VHLVGFITKKRVTMHGHMNVKFSYYRLFSLLPTEKHLQQNFFTAFASE